MILPLLASCELVDALRPPPPVEVVAEAPPPAIEAPVEPDPLPMAAPSLPPGTPAVLLNAVDEAGTCALGSIMLPSMSRKVIARFSRCPERVHMAPGAPRWLAEGPFAAEGATALSIPAYLFSPETGATEAVPAYPPVQDRAADESRLALRPDAVLLWQANYTEVEGECEGPCREESASGTWRLGPGGWEAAAGKDIPYSNAVLDRVEDWPASEWMGDPATVELLRAAAGDRYPGSGGPPGDSEGGAWHRHRPADASIPALVYWVTDGEESSGSGPMLVEQGTAWAMLPETDGTDRGAEVRAHWLLVTAMQGIRVHDLRDLSVVARFQGNAWFWPENVPVPPSAVAPTGQPARP